MWDRKEETEDGPQGQGMVWGCLRGRCGVRAVEALGKTADTQKSRGLLEEPGAGCREEGPAAGASPASQPGSRDVKHRLPVGLGVRGPRCAAQCPVAVSPVRGVGLGVGASCLLLQHSGGNAHPQYSVRVRRVDTRGAASSAQLGHARRHRGPDASDSLSGHRHDTAQNAFA